ncbi:carboxymuconolactone decarboxylase family protein [Limimaricola pyoseonensis]|uniref:Alkylhydroperoxidase family enzyme, contains CxxC motif n=1 Tax=Limimaricola pyoseonensis TaxID=521013 RepID=A0A1G7G012_9RHOB|nr:carboxymuconolactone decarboxylase family protein [Limimaricola pyoseonensis]SDE81365.1 Alkylhydroperoxidase family enzyme, contains CxxC motif [Limimaricola pyoseonensis]
MTGIAPLPDADWPAEITDMLPGFAGRLDVYRVMAHHPALLRAWADLRQHVVVDTSLGLEFSEVVILRTGHRHGSAYEWGHHVSRARKLGMSEDRIASIAGPLEAMAPADAVIAGAVDELLQASRVSAARRAAVEDLVGRKGLFDLMATVGFYTTLAFLANSTDLELDEGIRAELDERPAPKA